MARIVRTNEDRGAESGQRGRIKQRREKEQGIKGRECSNSVLVSFKIYGSSYDAFPRCISSQKSRETESCLNKFR